MLQKIYDKIEGKISIWHSIALFLILSLAYTYMEGGFSGKSISDALFAISFMTSLLLVQLITFVVAHRIIVFAMEKKYKLKTNLKKYFSILIINYCLFSAGFFFLFMIFWMDTFSPVPGPRPVGIEVLILSLILSIISFTASLAFNLVLIKKALKQNYIKAVLVFILVIILTALLYAVNPYGLNIYGMYLFTG